jgi:Ser/Thr protein kinase RdoA (MazF antagonist)
VTAEARAALALWGFEDADIRFVAGRENRVWRVRAPHGDFALRLKRPGYRSDAELQSELDWMAAMAAAGLTVPGPVASRRGRLLETVGDQRADLLTWLQGAPLGATGQPLDRPDARALFGQLGADLARLHTACDAWTPPPGFRRCRWDSEGLVGDTPLWGRFWENPTLSPADRNLFMAFREAAARALRSDGDTPDQGLIHADPVRENVLVQGEGLALIDFDDGGWGYRLFDIATALLKNREDPDYPALQTALIAGYRALRPLDTRRLDLFLALRAVTYVGWIVPRMGEQGATERNRRFIVTARETCEQYIGKPATRAE